MAGIIVLGGGPSNEREVSLRSSSSIKSALDQAGFKTVFTDPVSDDSYLSTQNSIVFPILHGRFGEDGTVQKLLEEKSIPFLGSDSVSSANCFDKWRTIEILKQEGISVPRSDLITLDGYSGHGLAAKPHVLKIPDGGSSIGTYIIRESAIARDKATEIFSGSKMIIEELIEGVELTVPILDDKALPVIEIQPPEDGEFDYENKYNGKTKELCPPASIDNGTQKRMQQLSENVHKIMKCRHLSRVDIMLDKENNPYVLEINTIPGMTDQSLFPKSALQAGIDMPELVKIFYDIVVRDYSLK